MTTDDKAPGDGLPSPQHVQDDNEEAMIDVSPIPTMVAPDRMIAIDVGAGTQDVLIYEAGRPYENLVKLVLPSQTQIVARKIRDVTRARRPLHLTGTVMGGGASSDAVKDHLAAGLPVTATGPFKR